MTRVLVAKDSGAKSVGADAVAAAFEDAGAEVVRTGSRGLYWLEPMAEIDGVIYGPLAPEDAASVLADGAKRIGPLADIPEFANQTRMLFKRVGAMDPTDADAYRASGGEAGLNAALAMTPDAVIQAITDSGSEFVTHQLPFSRLVVPNTGGFTVLSLEYQREGMDELLKKLKCQHDQGEAQTNVNWCQQPTTSVK